MPPHVPCLCWGQELAGGKADFRWPFPMATLLQKQPALSKLLSLSYPHVYLALSQLSQLSFFASQVPATHPSCTHLSLSLSFLLSCSPAILTKLITSLHLDFLPAGGRSSYISWAGLFLFHSIPLLPTPERLTSSQSRGRTPQSLARQVTVPQMMVRGRPYPFLLCEKKVGITCRPPPD